MFFVCKMAGVFSLLSGLHVHISCIFWVTWIDTAEQRIKNYLIIVFWVKNKKKDWTFNCFMRKPHLRKKLFEWFFPVSHLNTLKVTTLVTTTQKKQLPLSLATYVLHMMRKSDIVPERSALPAPRPPRPPPLHGKVLSGWRLGHSGAVQCWRWKGPLPSDISRLPHWRGGDHDSCFTWLEYEGLVAAVEDTRKSVGAFEVEKGGDREDQEQADQQCSQKERGCHTWASNFGNDSSNSCVISSLHSIVVGAHCYVLQIHWCWITENTNSVAVL